MLNIIFALFVIAVITIIVLSVVADNVWDTIEDDTKCDKTIDKDDTR